LATKVSETVVAAEVVCRALNKMSFFAGSSEAASVSARARVGASTRRDGPIKLRLGSQLKSIAHFSWKSRYRVYEPVVRQLLAENGVDPDSKDRYGRTPLSWAARNGHEAVVRLLII
jgi:ankyrin repeat protein